MEFSSPLAAMQPPAAPWGFGRDIPNSRQFYPGSQTLGVNSFNFRDLSMKKSQPDYFSQRPIRGSSPTASLAADLSQNMTIDQSPQLPTPRRSLFTTNSFQAPEEEGTTTPPIRWEGVMTPPIPSSSPGFDPEGMDITPLPHKLPQTFVSQIAVQSPTPEPTPQEEDMISPCSVSPPPNPLSNPLLELPRPAQNGERRKTLSRPSLTRTKGFSTNTVSLKTKENQLPPFRFGSGFTNLPDNSAPSLLEECFQESPPQERKPLTNQLMGAPRPRQPLFNNSPSSRGGSPVTSQIRKPTAPARRPHKQFRRSLSMFEHPGDVMKQEKKDYTPSGLQSIMDIDDTYQLKLPHFIPCDEPESLPRIQGSTMIDVLNGEYAAHFEDTIVVDCRFEYEYNGGHINGAMNYCDKEELAAKLFPLNASLNTLIIFHCEYSHHRAPGMASFIRRRDRLVNSEHYPRLTYPEMYILEGGYSEFFKSHRTRCFPESYLQMDSKDHEDACERGMDKVRRRAKLSRAQTFAFGQQSCQMEDSPTASGSRSADSVLPMDLVVDQSFLASRLHARRMASY